jgi:DNA-binding MarR family transcriptional regulator
MAQLKALVAIAHQPGVSVCQVARQLSIGESAASLMTDQLVRRGHVERATDPDDRRRVRLSVTKCGQLVLGELREGNRQVLSQWLRQLDDEQRGALARGVQALAGAANASLMSLVAVGGGAVGERS